LAQVSVAEPAVRALETAETARLYERHSPRVFRYCLRMLGNREDAEDATQTTFMQAFRAHQRGVVPTFEIAWLLTIARNVCHARYRSGKRRAAVELVRDPQDIEELAAGAEAADSVLVGLQAALVRLPEMQRRAFLLREWKGHSYAEIAEELGVTVPAVEALIFRARRALANDLGGEVKRRGHVFDFASLLAGAVKSLLGAGTAAKVAVSAATVVSAGAVVGGAVQMQRDEPPVPRPAPPVTEIRTSPTGSQQAPVSTPRGNRPAAQVPAAAPQRRDGTSRTDTPRRKKPEAPAESPGSSAPGSPSAPGPQSPAPSPPVGTAPQPAPPSSAPSPAPPPAPELPVTPEASTTPPLPIQLPPVVEDITEQLPVQLPELPDTSELPVVGPIVEEVPVVDDVLDGLPLGLGRR
jgi:RNA polymerase sigma-70 factor, ECF subfamily